MSWCSTVTAILGILYGSVIFVKGIEYGISTQPSDLGFEKYVQSSSETRSLFFIQPTKSGFIEANIGGVESRHDYNMSSISVYLSSNMVTMQGNFISDLYALCGVENAHLVAKSKAILLCQFAVSMPSYDGYIFSTSSCLIHCAKETECAAKINLDFLIRQAAVSINDKSELMISFNVTALDVNSLNPREPVVERDDVTNSLIYKHMKLPPVYVHRRPDTEFATLLTNENGFPSIQLEVPRISEAKFFDLVILQTSSTNVWKMKLKFVFSSHLRFLWAKEIKGGHWKLQGTPSPRGVTVKLRHRSTNQHLSSPEDLNDSFLPLPPEDEFITQRAATQIGLLRFERVKKSHNRPSASISDSFTHLPTSLPHMNDPDSDDLEIEDADEPEIIKVRVTGVDWQKGVANTSRIPEFTERLVRLPIPETLPDPNSMHIFVQFQLNYSPSVLTSGENSWSPSGKVTVRRVVGQREANQPTDILEPPWSPSREPPPPRLLKVLGLVPPALSNRPSSSSHRSTFDAPSAGRLIQLTNKVYCRTVTQTMSGPLAATLPMLHRAQSTCPFQMREAPLELEQNPPFGEVMNGGKILLGLQESGGGPPVFADMTHVPPALRTTVQWIWRSWIGPTVRRWHFENFNIRLQSDKLRRISNFPVFDNSSDNCTPRYEQTKITVTARIFTTLPDTGERMYLSDILPGGVNLDDISSREYSHLSHRPAELDVTHLLPSWSLRLRPFPSTSDFSASPPRQPAVIFRNKRSAYPILIGRSEGHVRIELIAAPKDSQPLAFKDVSIVSTEKNDFVRLKVECISWLITLSGHLDPHPSAETLLRSTTDSYGVAIVNEETSQALLPNEKEMIADFASHPHPRVLNLIVRGQDPTDLNVVTAQLNSGSLQNASSSSQNVFCPLGKIALSLVLEDGSEMGLYLLPEGQVRVSAQLQTTRKLIVWDPSKPLGIMPVTEEGKALVAAGKIGLGPMVDAKSIALWAGQPVCSPRPSMFLPDTRPLVSISTGSQEDPGLPVDGFDWEQDAIEKFRRSTGPIPIRAFDYSRSHFLVPRDSQNPDNHNLTDAQAESFFSAPMKYALFSIIIFSAIFFSVGCLALIIARHRRIVRRRKARIEEDPNNTVNGGKLPGGIFPVSPHMSTTTAATATTMNPGLSCSSVFSGNSGGAHTPAQTAELINQWTGRQSHQILPPPQCSSCSNSVGTRSPESDAVRNDLRASAMVDLRFSQVNVPSMKLNASQAGMMSPASPNFSSKWRAPESLGSAPSSRNTGSPSTNDEGFASGPLDLQAKRQIYSRGDSGGWGLGVSQTVQSPCPCQASSPHTSHHSSDIIRGSTCGYIQGGYMGTSMAGLDSSRFYGGQSGESIPPRLTLAHDPESIGTSKYLSKLNQLPPSLLLPSEMMKMETSHTAGAGFIGDTTEDKMLMDSGRESQDKTSSSGTSSGMNKDFSSMSGIEMTQVDV